MHTGERPFVCDVEGCFAAFARSGALTNHRRTHTGELPFVCDVEGCGAAFAQSGALTTHRRTHTGERPYLCDVEGCGAAFTTSGNLATHRRTHTGERPYLCDVEGCGAAFAQSGALTTHRAVWHTRCQSAACAAYGPEDRGRGTYCVEGLRYCFNCVAALWPERVRTAVRRELLVLGELLRLAPELEAHAVSWRWDCTVPGGCSLKRPDLLFVFADRYVQIEVDEHGHAQQSCWDEDARLELIAADVAKPGLVLRVNPDEAPMLRRRKRPDGELVWEPTPSFHSCLARAVAFLRDYVAQPRPAEAVLRFFLDRDEAPRLER